jgi:uncharacterized protein YceK
MRRFALALAVLLVLGGCAGTTGPAASGSAAAGSAAAAVTVTLVRTGGFAGVHDTVTINPDGTWQASGRAGNPRTGTLTDEQRDTLRKLAGDPQLAGEATRSQAPTRCADVYVYVLTVNGTRVGFVDCPTDADPPQAARAIVRFVTQVVGD